MSNYTGGYQFSHMHQSLDAEEMDPIYDNEITENIFINDGVNVQDPGTRNHFNNSARPAMNQHARS